MSKTAPEPRQAIFDELGVSRPTADASDPSALYVSLSHMDVADLICEGGIEGLVSGEYHFEGMEGGLGYENFTFEKYSALDELGNCDESLGFLRSIYWNETPVVDKDGFYNFQEVNVEWNDGSPQGKLPTLNSNLPNAKNIKGEDSFELTLFRNIGERLFGPTIDANNRPGYYVLNGTRDDGSPIGGSKNFLDVAFGALSEETIEAIKKTSLAGGAVEDIIKDENGNPIFGAGTQLIPADEVVPNGLLNVTNSPIILGEIDRNAKTYVISNKECVGVRVNIRVTRLLEQIQDDPKDNIEVEKGDKDTKGFFAQPEKTAKRGKQQPYGAGDMRARKIRYQIYTRPIYDTRHAPKDRRNFYAWQKKPDIDDKIFGRIEEPYVRSVDISFDNGRWASFNPRESADFEFFQGWEIKIVRLTPDSLHTFLKNESYIDSIVEIYDSKLRYPYSSMVYSKFSAEFFQRIPSRAYDTKLLKVKIPNNYDPILRSYDESSGFWDGCFKAEKFWTNNPAWCFYDIITNNRYGLGDYVDSEFVDKWTLYEIAKYCDTLVSDGKGGLEPRFTLNHLITSREEAYKVVNDLASAFRSLVYYAFGNIYVSQDKPATSIYQFNTSNVVDGLFNYSSSAKKARHTVAIVRYNDKNNMYKPAISYTEDAMGVQRYGIREIETAAIGCTSEGQAKRFGEWILQSEILETESVTFTAGEEGMYLRPGDIVSVYDEFRNDRNLAGRTIQVKELNSGIIPSDRVPSSIGSDDFAITGNSIILDKAIEFTPDKAYKLNLLTPTSYYEPSQITPTECEETVTTTTIPANTEEEVEEEADKIYKDYTKEDGLYGSVGSNGYSIFINTFSTTNTVTVDAQQGKFTFNYQTYRFATEDMPADGSGQPQRFVLSYVRDGVTYYLDLTKGTFSTDEFAGSFYIGSRFVTSTDDIAAPDLKHGQKDRNGARRAENGDLIACLESYGNAAADAELDFLLNNGQVLEENLTDGIFNAGDLNHAKTFRQGRKATNAYAEGVLTFTKPEGVTTITIKTVHPINTTSTGGISSIFRIGLVRNTKTSIKKSTEEKIVETITTSATNTDKALTSADIPEIRKNQIQTLYFSGFQTKVHTGNYNSDFSVGGSGIVTQIFFDSSVKTQEIDFQNYVVTGYNTSSVIGDLAAGTQQEYNSSYENFSGSNLIWSIEPADKSDLTRRRHYTLDKELSSGYMQEYRVINVIENEKKYDISAIEYNQSKFELGGQLGDKKPINGGGKDPVVGGPPEDPRCPDCGDDDEDGGGGDDDPFDPIEGEDGSCCVEKKDSRECYNDYKRSQCDAIDKELREKGEGSATFHKDQTCDQIDCQTITAPITPNPPVKPVPVPGEPAQQFIDLTFKMEFDLASITTPHVGHAWRLKQISDDDAYVEAGKIFDGILLPDHEEQQSITEAGLPLQDEDGNDISYTQESMLGFYYEELCRRKFDESLGFSNKTTLELYEADEIEASQIVGFLEDTYSLKTELYGDSFLLSQEVVFTNTGVNGEFLYSKEDRCEAVSSAGTHNDPYKKDDYREVVCPIPAAYGLPKLTGTGFDEPEWESDAANSECLPPSIKDYYVPYDSDKPSGFLKPILIYLGDQEAGKSPTRFQAWSASLKNRKTYFSVIPDEKYELIVQQFIYKFPNFLRDDYGELLTEKQIDTLRAKGEHIKDIRDFKFKDLKYNGSSRVPTGTESEALPYKAGCSCDENVVSQYQSDYNTEWKKDPEFQSSETDTRDDGRDGRHIDEYKADLPYADINLDYKQAILSDSHQTKKISIRRSDLGTLNLCVNNEIKKAIFEFTNIRPQTIFNSELQAARIKNNQKDSIVDYIADGQYLVTVVSMAPEEVARDCHNQVGFRYCFAQNLKDLAIRPPVPNTNCTTNPVFATTTQADFFSDPSASRLRAFDRKGMPKLYDVPEFIIDKYFANIKITQDNLDSKSYMPLQFPGASIRVLDRDGKYVKNLGFTDCIYLAGEEHGDEDGGSNYHIAQVKGARGLKLLQRRVPSSYHNNETISFKSNEFSLEDSLGTSVSNGAITLIADILKTADCSNQNKVVLQELPDGTQHYEYNVHFQLQSFDQFTDWGVDNGSLHGPNDPERTVF